MHLLKLLVASTILIGCATPATISTYRDPSAIVATRVTVLYPTNDLQSRRYVETAINACLQQTADVAIDDSEEFFPPIGQVSPKAILAKLKTRKVDLVLYVTQAGMAQRDYQLPSTVLWSNNGGTVYPGGTISSFAGSATVTAMDVRLEKPTWVATVSSNGGDYSGVVNSMIRAVCKELPSDGLITAKPKSIPKRGGLFYNGLGSSM